MPKQILLILVLLLAAANAPAQVYLDAALDSLENMHLVTQLEKAKLLERAVPLEKSNDYSRPDELLGLLGRAKMFSTSGTDNGFLFMAAPASSRSLPAPAIRAELDSFIRALDTAGLLSA